MTTHLPARVETFTCDECETTYPSALAAARCAEQDTAYSD